MSDIICLDPNYSTTRRVTRSLQGPQSNSYFEPVIRLADNPFRIGEGGLRNTGYFKAAGISAPLVTVVTVVFNGAKTLEKTILSVINQSYGNIEFIVIDAGSTDASIDIIRNYEHAIDYWVSEPDAGIYDAWNKGVQLSRGDWISFLGSDDEYREDAVQAYISFIERHSIDAIEYVSSKVNLIKNSKVLGVTGGRWNWQVLRKYMNLAQVGSMHSRHLFERFGIFDATYKISGDYQFLLRSGPSLRAGFLDLVTVDMQVGGVSDANIRAFHEVTKAKITVGKRSVLISHLEEYWAIFKWKLRNYLRS